MLRKPHRSRPTARLDAVTTGPVDPGPAHRVLLVEDESDLRRLLRILLAADGRLEVAAEASSADEAIAALASAPEVVILDHGIEGSSTGSDLAPTIRATLPDAKVILFTAYDQGVVAAALPHVDAYLRKDSVATLVPLIHRLLGLDPVPARRSPPG